MGGDRTGEGDQYWFIPVYETKNFFQGLIYRPAKGSQIDKVYNREFYVNHFEKLFKDGFDPVLAGVGDLLIDLSSLPTS